MHLDEMVAALGLTADAAAGIERQIMGTTREKLPASPVGTEADQITVQGDERRVERDVETDTVGTPPPERGTHVRYEDAVRLAWADGRLHRDEAAALGRLAEQLELLPDTVAAIERSIMGATRDEILQRSRTVPPGPVPSTAPVPFPVREIGGALGGLVTFVGVFLPAYENDNYWGEGGFSAKFLILAPSAVVASFAAGWLMRARPRISERPRGAWALQR